MLGDQKRITTINNLKTINTNIYTNTKIYNFRNIVHFLKRILQVVDNAVFWQNVLLYFEHYLLSPSF